MRRYSGRRRGVYISPLYVVLALVLAAAAIFLFFRQPEEEEDAPREPQGTQTGQPVRSEEPRPAKAATASGIACTLTELGEEAVHTGELILVNNQILFRFPREQDLVSIYQEKSGSYYVRDMEVLLSPVAMGPLNALLDDFLEQGGSKSVNVVAGHRTEEFQQHLFDQSAERNGLDHAKKYVAQPGGSEHHTGLVVDLSILHGDGTSGDYDGTGEYAWINENCHRYGWVVRYETGKEELTGIWDEPWHFRYVGVPHATAMAEGDLCLEEYIDELRRYPFEGEHLTVDCADGTYEIWYCQGTEAYLPDSGDYQVSGNNVDGFVVTYKVS